MGAYKSSSSVRNYSRWMRLLGIMPKSLNKNSNKRNISVIWCPSSHLKLAATLVNSSKHLGNKRNQYNKIINLISRQNSQHQDLINLFKWSFKKKTLELTAEIQFLLRGFRLCTDHLLILTWEILWIIWAILKESKDLKPPKSIQRLCRNLACSFFQP